MGYFEEANGGTLFLDEITEMGSELQVKLLRVLEARLVRRVGASQDIRVDVRLISATNRDPEEAIGEGKLREDLYYRLNVFPIVLPTLAERREDIPLLAEHFRRQIEEQEKAGVTGWDPAALQMLDRHDWPGNVRELRNVVHRAYVMAEGDTIRPGRPGEPPAGRGRETGLRLRRPGPAPEAAEVREADQAGQEGRRQPEAVAPPGTFWHEIRSSPRGARLEVAPERKTGNACFGPSSSFCSSSGSSGWFRATPWAGSSTFFW